ncbi:MAG TPA: M28 family peptidase [Clostridia bacterium]|nr:M28 family peptidase [Clostridia bacterium]
MKDIEGIINETSKERMRETIEWLTSNTPYRLAGSDDEKRAAEYISGKMRQYGLEVINQELYTYNSDPVSSEIEVISPVKLKPDSLPCAHIRSTSEDGDVFDVVYVGTGSYEAYEGLNVSGKMVLVEVSYAPPVPEKARIASSMGAAGIICMNWGNDEEVICNRGLKAVWGNPTVDTFRDIPDITGVSISRTAGLKLKELCTSGQRVQVKVSAIADRKWSKVHQPVGIIHGNGKSDQFILVSSHIDAWKPGVTCNATGNATTLELCRILAKHKDELDRNIYFVFWNGHEIAEAAGSTWFVDNNWKLLGDKCVGYINIDSTGVRETEIFEIKASDELLDFAEKNAQDVLRSDVMRVMPLKKIGDQSLMGIGVPAIAQRMSFTQEVMDRNHGATLGWWNHTCEDGLDKCDMKILYEDTRVTLSLIYRLAQCRLLPYNFRRKFEDMADKVLALAQKHGSELELTPLYNGLVGAGEAVAMLQKRGPQLTEAKQIDDYNRFMLTVSRLTTNVFQTYADKFQQDSYGYTKLSAPVPLLADLAVLDKLEKDSLEYGMLTTQLVKNRNRILEALDQVKHYAGLYERLLVF